MKNRILGLSKIMGIFFIPNSFQGRVTLRENPLTLKPIFEVTQLSDQDNLSDLIQMLESQLGENLKIKQVSPENMVLSTQDNVPIK